MIASQQTIATGEVGRVVALEEHFSAPALVARIPRDRMAASGFPASDGGPALLKTAAVLLPDLGTQRLADMDANGIDVQVLSWAGPGADLLAGGDAVSFAREANDLLADAVAAYPDRFAGFAHLCTAQPEQAAAELERCVGRHGFVGAMINGTVNGEFLDGPRFEPLLAAAEQLGVPIYLHPNVPPKAVRDAYYSNLPDPFGFLLSTYGFGWHAEVAVHVLRLVLSGTLDRHPGLKLCIGHLGEFLPMALARTSQFVLGDTPRALQRSVAETLRSQLWVTSAGVFTQAPLQAAIAAFGIDRVLFSVDYPYSGNAEARAFLGQAALAPADRRRFAHATADALLRLSPAGPTR